MNLPAHLIETWIAADTAERAAAVEREVQARIAAMARAGTPSA